MMSNDWFNQKRRKVTKICSIQEFVLHLIAEGTRTYQGTCRQDTFMFWHDRLSILWDKTTQEWLRRLKCPIDGWDDRTWADRFIRIRGKYNSQVSKYYADSLPGDSPELMPLDCHLFSDIKEGVARNVAFSFFMKDDDPDKYSLRTPRLVFDSIERTIKNGCPSTERIRQDIQRIPETMRRIKEAKGTYIEDHEAKSPTPKKIGQLRSGVRGEKEKETRRAALSLNSVNEAVQKKFSQMIDDMLGGKGMPFGSFDSQLVELVEIDDTERGFHPSVEISVDND